MIHYVCGLLFNNDFTKVVLIKKNRPDFLKDKLNGVGGHVEPNEEPIDAIRREFLEETGQQVDDWQTLWVTQSEDYRVDFYWASEDIDVKSLTDEEVSVHELKALPLNLAPDIGWLIEKALLVSMWGY